MLNVELAGLNITIDNRYAYIRKYCQEYLADFETADISVFATEEETMAEDKESEGYSASDLETLAVYRKIADKLVDYEGFLMHGVVLDICGTGVAFLAQSGVGKSTHARMWKDLLGDKMTVVNGDKPLVRFDGNTPYAYGTPWAGKEGIQTNMKTPLKNICFIQRAETNECVKLDKKAVLPLLMPQIHRPQNPMVYVKTIDLMTRLVENADFYLVKCTPTVEAAEVAYNTIF